MALGLARLGVAVTLKTRLGRDAFGEMIQAHLEASGVQVDGGAEEGTKTTLAIATLAAGIASYDFRIDWDLDASEPLPIETRCLHTGSLATVVPPGGASVVGLVEREHERGRVTVSYDPNVRPGLLGDVEQARPGIEHLVAMSDVVKVSDEDLRWLYPDRPDEDVAQAWLASGPALVVGGQRRDALASIDEATLASVIDAAALIAAMTCAKPGADPPTRAQVDAAQSG